ncbi:hypothetical protein [Sphingopyxis fribergensis]
MTHSPNSDGAIIKFSTDEAIVLFELLQRWTSEDGAGETPNAACFVSSGEGAALNGLLAQLERQLSTPLENGYLARLAGAQERLSNDWGYSTLRG